MIEENQKYFNRLTGVVDILVCAVSYLLAWFLRFRTTLLFGTSVEAVPFAVYMEALMVIIPIMIILYSGFNLYGTNHRIKGRRFVMHFENLPKQDLDAAVRQMRTQ